MIRLLKDTTPLQRGIIRHLIIVIDLSSAMAEKDLRPTRYALTLRYAGEFVTEFFEQNPISQLGIIGMRDGIAVRVSDMGGNPSDHITNLQALHTQEPKGSPSVQNALDMGRAALLSVSPYFSVFSLWLLIFLFPVMRQPMAPVRSSSYPALSYHPTPATSIAPLVLSPPHASHAASLALPRKLPSSSPLCPARTLHCPLPRPTPLP